MGNARTSEKIEKYASPADPVATPLAAVADALSRLRYGAVHLTVHDGRVVQLDITERQRFT